MTQAYPLQWPAGWPRTPPERRETGKFKTTLSGALSNLQSELRLLGGKNLVLSSNVTLGEQRPSDPGIAAYFTYDGDQACIPCDRWRLVEHNVQAIAKTIEAMRGIERWGAKHMVKAAFRGFTALPAPKRWEEVLGFQAGGIITREAVEARYRQLARTRHPDAGGSDEAMAELNAARDQAIRALEEIVFNLEGE